MSSGTADALILNLRAFVRTLKVSAVLPSASRACTANIYSIPDKRTSSSPRTVVLPESPGASNGIHRDHALS